MSFVFPLNLTKIRKSCELLKFLFVCNFSSELRKKLRSSDDFFSNFVHMRLLFCILQAVSVLVFGHSYGVDCTEYLPSLAVEAGIETLHIGRFIKGNCSLEEHYDYFVNDTTGKYSECLPGEVSYTSVPKTVRQALSETKWDYVVFQTSLENEGRYETVQPYLDDLIAFVRTTQKEHFGKAPVLCWNMFWPISVLNENGNHQLSLQRLSIYGGKSLNMWKAYKATAKQIRRKTAITRIIPSGTAVMAFRASDMDVPEAKELTRDGYHMSYGGGRYLAACTWFESLLTREYGVSVVGNKFRTEKSPVPVTDDSTALQLQKLARHAARHPFGE